ncbi:MAG: hypothetical protein U1F77_01405 [Kiritimatiellia bacterium]
MLPDTDGDFSSDGEAARARIMDPVSRLRILVDGIDADGVHLRWSSVAGKTTGSSEDNGLWSARPRPFPATPPFNTTTGSSEPRRWRIEVP